MTRNYYWNEMQNFVRRYCNHCNVCRRSKFSRFKKQKILRTLFISQRRWRDINIDLIIDFFEVNDYNVIVNIVNRLTKKRHHIFCNKTFDVEKLTTLFMKHVWRYHEFFTIIICDRDFRFINDFWKKLCKRLNIEVKLFIVWHSKNNNQSEKLKNVMTKYFKVYVNYNQNDWLKWLFIIEFVKNNTIFNIIKVIFFYVNKNFHSRMNFELSKE